MKVFKMKQYDENNIFFEKNQILLEKSIFPDKPPASAAGATKAFSATQKGK